MSAPPKKGSIITCEVDEQKVLGTPPLTTSMAVGVGKKSAHSLEELRRIAETVHRKKDLSVVEKHRQMSIIYSRRKRIKQKMRWEGLEEQRHELLLENERVRKENDHLECILNQAKTAAAVIEREKAVLRAHMLQEKEEALNFASSQLLTAANSMPHRMNLLAASGLGRPRGFDVRSFTSLMSESSRSRLLTRSLCPFGTDLLRSWERTSADDLASNLVRLRAQELIRPPVREAGYGWDLLHRNGC